MTLLVVLLATHCRAAPAAPANGASSGGRVVRTKYGNLRGITLPGASPGEPLQLSPSRYYKTGPLCRRRPARRRIDPARACDNKINDSTAPPAN